MGRELLLSVSVTMVTTMLSWQPKMHFFRVNRLTIRNMLDVTMTLLVTWVTSPDTVRSHWPPMTSWLNI